MIDHFCIGIIIALTANSGFWVPINLDMKQAPQNSVLVSKFSGDSTGMEKEIREICSHWEFPFSVWLSLTGSTLTEPFFPYFPLPFWVGYRQPHSTMCLQRGWSICPNAEPLSAMSLHMLLSILPALWLQHSSQVLLRTWLLLRWTQGSDHLTEGARA